MNDRKEPVEDRERLERYLAWRRRDDRAARRWRRVRAVAVVLFLGLAAFLVMTWTTHGSRPTGDRLALEPRAAGPVPADGGSGAPAMTPEPAPPGTDPPEAALGVPAPPPPRAPAVPRRAGQRRVSAARGRAARTDAAASPASTSPAPVSQAPAVTAAPGTEAPTASTAPVAAETSPSIAQGNAQTPPPGVIPPSGVTSSPVGPPAVAQTPRAQCARVFGDGSGAAADQLKSRGAAAADCVGGWVKGEAQEFGDGVKRQVGEFRAGFDKVRLGVSRLRSRLGGSE